MLKTIVEWAWVYCAALGLACCARTARTDDTPTKADAPVYEFRTWSDKSEKFQTEAALVDFKEGKVSLKKRDGSLVSLALDSLSLDDRNYVRAHFRAKPADNSIPKPVPKTPEKPEPANPPEKTQPPEKPEPSEKPAPPDSPSAAPDPAQVEIYERITKEYLNGPWDDLEQELAKPGGKLTTLTREQQNEITYIRRTLAECRPAWWKECKAAKSVPIKQVVWGHPLAATYDPVGKSSLEMKFTGNVAAFTVAWPADEMDNTKHAEHGFSKGELNNLGIWATLGMASFYAQTPPQNLVNLSEADKLNLSRYLGFRGNLTALYYGAPRSRQWGEFLYLLSWMDKYAKMPTVYGRKAVGAMFIAEVLANPAKYPSLPLPAKLEADGAEQKLAEHFRSRIEKHGWTVAEDISLRTAMQIFAAANEAPVLTSQKVTLPNKLSISLDPDADAALRPKRDAWLKTAFDKAREPARPEPR